MASLIPIFVILAMQEGESKVSLSAKKSYIETLAS